MVKRLDESHLLLPEHIGVDLWRAATAWKTRLHRQMVARGHSWYGDARGAVAAHLDPRGVSQSELVARMGLSKQAVQQLLDGLEADGIVRRVADPNDRRGNRVEYTAKGLAALRDAAKVKRKMELEMRQRIGDRAFDALATALREVASTWND
jgi:DNA-binding MarR family transcriptional regulator